MEEPAAPAGPTDRPTEAGIPIFDDDGDVSWLAKRAEKPPPPPPFDAIPERPLFAPDPADGSPVRRPRVPAGHQGGPHPGTGPGGYWPWDTSTGTGAPVIMSGSGIIEPVEEDDEVDDRPGRSWLWLAALVAALVLVLLAVVVAFNVGRGRTPLGAEPEPESSRSPSATTTQTAEAGLTAYDGVTATDFDPQGEDLQENPELAPLAVDGDPETAWRTQTYLQQLGPAGLKTGVGTRARPRRVRRGRRGRADPGRRAHRGLGLRHRDRSRAGSATSPRPRAPPPTEPTSRSRSTRPPPAAS